MNEFEEHTEKIEAHEVVIGTLSQATHAAEINQQVATAKAYPRSIERAKREAYALATMDVPTAESCSYALKKGKTVITGPSIRFAEIIAYAWGNLRVDDEILGEDGDFIVSRATAFDLERNYASRSTVRRRIVDRDGKRYATDTIQSTGQAASAIARRNAIFDVIPAVLVSAVYDQVLKVAEGDEKTFGRRLEEWLAWWKKEYDLSSDEACALVEAEGPGDVRSHHLRIWAGMRTSLHEGRTTIQNLLRKGVAEPVADMARGQDAADRMDKARLLNNLLGTARDLNVSTEALADYFAMYGYGDDTLEPKAAIASATSSEIEEILTLLSNDGGLECISCHTMALLNSNTVPDLLAVEVMQRVQDVENYTRRKADNDLARVQAALRAKGPSADHP